MRKFLLHFVGVGLLSLVSYNGMAREIPSSQAAQIASGFSHGTSAARRVQGNAQPVLVHTEKDASGANLFYVFNRPGSGFIIVSADDQARAVLAYSDTEQINDFNLIPENMRNMLRDYASQIVSMRGRSGAKAPIMKAREAVAPLLTSQWNQAAPYNQLMPPLLVEGEEGVYQNAVTGCVATALAQVINYWKYPTEGIGSEEYTDVDGRTFGTNYEHNYNYDLMTDEYNEESSSECNFEVARLMWDCAVGVHMYFLLDGSESATSMVPSVLINHFGYDKGILYEPRSYYTDEEWEDKVYAEIAAKRPVMYAANSTVGGHTFIIDGADENGLFHVNWGWGGFENGYFALTGAEVLNPEGGGAGGAENRVSYNQGQHAVFGIQPDKGNPYILRFVSEEAPQLNVSEVSRPIIPGDPNAWVTVSGRFVNLSLEEQYPEFALRFINTATNEEKIVKQNVSSIDTIAGVGLGGVLAISVHQYELEWDADGEWDITPLWRVGGDEGEWQTFTETVASREGKPLRVNLVNGHAYYLTKKVEVTATAADGVTAKVSLHANKDVKGYIRPFIAEEQIQPTGLREWIVMSYQDGGYLFDSQSTEFDLKAGEDKEFILGPYPYDTYKYNFNALLRVRVSEKPEVTREDITPDAKVEDDIEAIFTMTIAEKDPIKIYNAGFLTAASGVGDDLLFTVPVHANVDVKGKLAVHVFRQTNDNDDDSEYGCLPDGSDQDIPVVDIDLPAGSDSIITIAGKFISDNYNFNALARVFFYEEGELDFYGTAQVLTPFTTAAQTVFQITDPVHEFLIKKLTDLEVTSDYCDSLAFTISLYSNMERDIYLIIPYVYQYYEDEENPEQSGYYMYVDSEQKPLADTFIKKVHLSKGVNTFALGPIFYNTEEYNVGGSIELYYSLDGTWDLDDDDFYYNNFLADTYFEIGTPVGIQDVPVAEGLGAASKVADKAIYSITGQRMNGNVRRLPRGLYIVDGKKVLVQ